MANLYEALNKRGIKLLVYLPSGAPAGDHAADTALEWRNGPYPNREFQAKWEQVIREWSQRWGKKVVGWWFDGCYFPNSMGEIDQPERVTIRRATDGKMDGAQIQMLSYLGTTWGIGSPRFSTEQAVGFSRKIVDAGGAVTWDVPVELNGTISQAFLDHLAAVGKALRSKL